MKDCKLHYTESNDSSSYIVIKDTSHTEYYSNDRYFIKSTLDWISECEFNATIMEITVPSFPFRAGDIMNVKVNKIENNIIYCTMNALGFNTTAEFKILK